MMFSPTEWTVDVGRNAHSYGGLDWIGLGQ